MTVHPLMTDGRCAGGSQSRQPGRWKEVLGRKTPEQVVSPGTYDQKHIARIGHLHDCIAYGPGILDLAHQPDEFIVIDDMVAVGQGHGGGKFGLAERQGGEVNAVLRRRTPFVGLKEWRHADGAGN